VSINNPWVALKYILQTNVAISSKLAKYTNGITPLIGFGELAEGETGLPCLIFTDNPSDINRKIEDADFTINCYASTKYDSADLARTIVKELNGGQEFANGYPITITCNSQGSIPDPSAKEVNTPVEIRLYNINGGA
jgi:hypothetical protein